MKQWIPNALSLGNAVCGFLALYAIFHESNPILACWFILVAAIFDVFDGMLARSLGVAGPLGVQLDSLADVISFGAVPASMLYFILSKNGWNMEWSLTLPAFMLAMSVLRLAKFNIDGNQNTDFMGLPTPANGLFWAGMAVIHSEAFDLAWLSFLQNEWVIAGLAILLSVFLNLPMPLLSLKFKALSIQGNEYRVALIVGSLLILAIGVVFYANFFVMLPIVILLYLILSITKNLIQTR